MKRHIAGCILFSLIILMITLFSGCDLEDEDSTENGDQVPADQDRDVLIDEDVDLPWDADEENLTEDVDEEDAAEDGDEEPPIDNDIDIPDADLPDITEETDPDPDIEEDSFIPLTLDEVRETLIELIVEDGDEGFPVEAMLFVTPIGSGADLHSCLDGENSLTLEKDSWLIVLDYSPGALYGHTVRYLILPVDGGEPVWFETDAPPALGDLPAFIFITSSLNGGGAPADTGGTRIEPETLADYGDAPEGSEAYYGGTAGNFPALESSNGARSLGCDLIRLGIACSYENGPDDADDPDGKPNFVNNDNDDGVLWFIAPDGDSLTHTLVVRVTEADDPLAPDSAYLNVLADLDRSGDWAQSEDWVVRNHQVDLEQGTSDYRVVLPLNLPTGATAFGGGMWVRVLLSGVDIQSSEWDGAGGFDEGEVEDFYISDAVAHATSIGSPILPPPEWEAPGEGFPGIDSVCGIEINSYALVLQGPDIPGGRPVARLSAASMNRFLAAQGYNTSILRPSTLAEIGQEIDLIKGAVHCLDSIFIYIVAHGDEYDGSGTGRMWLAGSLADAAQEGREVFELLAEIEACEGGEHTASSDTCEAPEQACKQTIVIESCFSGSQQADLDAFGDDNRGRTVIFSSSATQYSNTDRHTGVGLVAKAIQEAADDPEADADSDGHVTQAELDAYIRAKVDEASGHGQDSDSMTNEPDCPCICCGDGIVQSTQANVNGVMQPGLVEACELPGDACTTEADDASVCTDECQCPEIGSCGDGNPDFGEECGEPDLPECPDGQYCDDCECKTAICGDGNAEPGEECGEPGHENCPADHSCRNCKCILHECENGFADPGEDCGEPGLDPCDETEDCSECFCVTRPAVCGNGTVEVGESCGEPNLNNCTEDQYCDSCDCKTPVCGNDLAEPGEECGEPVHTACPPDNTCRDCKCVLHECENGFVDPDEECGEPGLDPCDAGQECVDCDCQPIPPGCGNGIIEEDEECGEPELDTCTEEQYCEECFCVTPICGNNKAEPGEECGEPEHSACPPEHACRDCICDPYECGNEFAEPGEECGEPLFPPCDETEDCSDCVCVTRPAVCGNESIEVGEECGEPGLNNCTETQYCDNCECVDPVCGNDKAEPGEECGEPEHSACPQDMFCRDCLCVTGVCGNDINEPGEECGEPDLPDCADGMYCSSECKCVEPVCGNGEAEPGEECGEPELDCQGGYDCRQCKCIEVIQTEVTAMALTSSEPHSPLEGAYIEAYKGEYLFESGVTGPDGIYVFTSLAADQTVDFAFYLEMYQPVIQTDVVIAEGLTVTAYMIRNVEPVCGNGDAEEGEECGEPSLPECGDGEYCDDCSCREALCGNTIIEPTEDCEPAGESCLDGAYCHPQTCLCIIPECGNDITEPGEECGEPGMEGCEPGKTCIECLCVEGEPAELVVQVIAADTQSPIEYAFVELYDYGGTPIDDAYTDIGGMSTFDSGLYEGQLINIGVSAEGFEYYYEENYTLDMMSFLEVQMTRLTHR